MGAPYIIGGVTKAASTLGAVGWSTVGTGVAAGATIVAGGIVVDYAFDGIKAWLLGKEE